MNYQVKIFYFNIYFKFNYIQLENILFCKSKFNIIFENYDFDFKSFIRHCLELF